MGHKSLRLSWIHPEFTIVLPLLGLGLDAWLGKNVSKTDLFLGGYSEHKVWVFFLLPGLANGVEEAKGKVEDTLLSSRDWPQARAIWNTNSKPLKLNHQELLFTCYVFSVDGL